MTAHRDLKRIIRERQGKTGESYAAARMHVMRDRAVLLGIAADEQSAEQPVRLEAAVLKVNQQSARVRIAGEDAQVTFRSRDVWPVVPGHLVTLVVEKQWTWQDDTYASGTIENPRIDIARLGLTPLPLQGGDLEDLRSAYEPYRHPDPYARLWRKLTAKRRPSYEMDPIAWGAFPGRDIEESPRVGAAGNHRGRAARSCRLLLRKGSARGFDRP
jgi:hypothetical protein